jgi:hypothetical protein
MRNLLLATAALAMACAGHALASGRSSITVTTTVPQSCTVNIPGTNVTLPADGSAAAAEPFTFSCNFTGSDAQLSYVSTKGGVEDGAGPIYPYNVVPALGNSGTSSANFSSGPLATTALTPVNTSFTLDLVGDIQVAGSYTDTLTISIAP